MDWSLRKNRLRVLIIIEIVVIFVMMTFVYGSTSTSSSEAQPESTSNPWIMILLFCLGIMGLLFQMIGLISLYIVKRWAKYIFSLGVVISAITSVTGNGGMTTGNWFLGSLALCYWLLAGAIIALSYEKQI